MALPELRLHRRARLLRGSFQLPDHCPWIQVGQLHVKADEADEADGRTGGRADKKRRTGGQKRRTERAVIPR